MKYLHLYLLPFLILLLTTTARGQQSKQLVYTIAGGGSETGDNKPALNSGFGLIGSIWCDENDDIYFTDENDKYVKKLITKTGMIQYVVGAGKLWATQVTALTGDKHGNLYISDVYFQMIYKYNIKSKIVTFVAGIPNMKPTIPADPALLADGIPATNAKLLAPNKLAVDDYGNLYIADDCRLRKVDTSGIITTVAGTFTSGNSGDNGLAKDATLSYILGLTIDNKGNIYISDKSHKVRKINTKTGIISHVAGTGDITTSYTAMPEPTNVIFDGLKNMYVGDQYTGKIRKVDCNTGKISYAAGVINTLGVDTNGAPATATRVYPNAIQFDKSGNLIYAEGGNSRIKKIINFPKKANIISDSFLLYIHPPSCNGITINVQTENYTPGSKIKITFGDGTTSEDTLKNGKNGGYAVINHKYRYASNYSIGATLVNTNSPVDSGMCTISYKSCNNLTGNFYFDTDNDCVYNTISDHPIFSQVLAEIDSNGKPVDTIKCTSGFNYAAYGVAGDVYTIKVISKPPGFQFSCPSNGILHDTLDDGLFKQRSNDIGFTCDQLPRHDFSIQVSSRAGGTDMVGTIIVQNKFCTPIPASVTVHLNPKFIYADAIPKPSSVSSNLITWNIVATAASENPIYINFSLVKPSTKLPYLPRDTVKTIITIDPIAGDIDSTDNIVITLDTIRTSYDPNYIDVSPKPYILSGTELTYTIEFENMGNDTAHDIYVLDTLSDLLDPTTFQIVSATARMNTCMFKDSVNKILKFDFPNIMLPDSSHHNVCKGMLVYKIKTRTGLPDGTIIPNKAGIYFDYNPVVMTNTIENIIGFPPKDSTIISTSPYELLNVYPNPTNTDLNISIDTTIFRSVTIRNTMNQPILYQELKNSKTTIDVKALSAGIYLLIFKGENTSAVRKFIKM